MLLLLQPSGFSRLCDLQFSGDAACFLGCSLLGSGGARCFYSRRFLCCSSRRVFCVVLLLLTPCGLGSLCLLHCSKSLAHLGDSCHLSPVVT